MTIIRHAKSIFRPRNNQCQDFMSSEADRETRNDELRSQRSEKTNCMLSVSNSKLRFGRFSGLLLQILLLEVTGFELDTHHGDAAASAITPPKFLPADLSAEHSERIYTYDRWIVLQWDSVWEQSCFIWAVHPIRPTGQITCEASTLTDCTPWKRKAVVGYVMTQRTVGRCTAEGGSYGGRDRIRT